MATKTEKMCDRCGRHSSESGGKKDMVAGSEYRWMTLRAKTNHYLYDDGTQASNVLYDLCDDCRMAFWEFIGEEDPLSRPDMVEKRRFQAKIRKKIRKKDA